MSVHHVLWAISQSQLSIRESGLNPFGLYGDLNDQERLCTTLDLWAIQLRIDNTEVAIHRFNQFVNHTLAHHPDRAVLLIGLLWDNLHHLPSHLSALPTHLAALNGETASREHLTEVLNLE
jgi:hypothetical protein